jgi:hypothetical protein
MTLTPNLVALHPSSFALYSWIAYLVAIQPLGTLGVSCMHALLIGCPACFVDWMLVDGVVLLNMESPSFTESGGVL